MKRTGVLTSSTFKGVRVLTRAEAMKVTLLIEEGLGNTANQSAEVPFVTDKKLGPRRVKGCRQNQQQNL